MPVTRTQFNHVENAASGTSIAVSLTGIAPGSLVKVAVRHDGTTTTGVTDDLSVAGALARGHTEGVDGIRIDVYYFKNHGGGNRTFTATFPAATARAIEVEELAGADTVNPLGPVNSANGSSNTAAAGSVTPGVDGAYIAGYEANASFDYVPQAPMVGVLSELTSVSDSSALAQAINAAVNPTWTSASVENWAAVAVVFLPAPTVATQPAKPLAPQQRFG